MVLFLYGRFDTWYIHTKCCCDYKTFQKCNFYWGSFTIPMRSLFIFLCFLRIVYNNASVTVPCICHLDWSALNLLFCSYCLYLLWPGPLIYPSFLLSFAPPYLIYRLALYIRLLILVLFIIITSIFFIAPTIYAVFYVLHIYNSPCPQKACMHTYLFLPAVFLLLYILFESSFLSEATKIWSHLLM